MKKWYQSRMIWINGLAFLASLLLLVQQFLVEGNFTEVAYVGLAYAAVNLLLRKVTTQAIK